MNARTLTRILVIFLLCSFLAVSFEALPAQAAKADRPRIYFTRVPRLGSFDNLFGRVENVDPSQYAVAVYIRVGRGWWTKPYWAWPVTPLAADGSWSCDITTGGIDEKANTITAFLIPKDFAATLRSGQANLPAKVRKAAVAKVTVRRKK
jgi:hypothetical protein